MDSTPCSGGAPAISDDEFADLMMRCPGVQASRRVAVGVSGGADSMALCLLLWGWARPRGIGVTALTVDHGLRPQAADEAGQVAGWLAAREIAHQTLRVTAQRPGAGLQRTARDWRLAAFDGWCRDHHARPVLLAHTAEDQAETLWMRVLADSGPDGLGAMTAETRVAGLAIARPLLPIGKDRLIATCRTRGQPWIEDPSNRQSDFTRVRLRGLAPALRELGIGTRAAARFASGMAGTRRWMDRYCAAFIKAHGGISAAGVVWFEATALADEPEAVADLLLSRILRSVGGHGLPARRKRVSRLRAELCLAGDTLTRTLGGCIIKRLNSGRCLVFRELADCAEPVLLSPGRPTRWDNRFEAISSRTDPVYLGALGSAGWLWLARHEPVTDARNRLAKLPHAARLSFPAIHELDGSVSVPHFESCTGTHWPTPAGSLDIRFCPDAGWMRQLVAPE